jgi:galactokinase
MTVWSIPESICHLFFAPPLSAGAPATSPVQNRPTIRLKLMTLPDSRDDFYSLPLAEHAAEVKHRFTEIYGQPPRWMAAAPGRVNLIGEHTDYNAGFVFPLAIERYTIVAAVPPEHAVLANQVHVQSTMFAAGADFSLDDLQPHLRDWTSYLRGVFAGCAERGMTTGPLNVLVDSKVPLGGGLSSSAALEVATATLIEAITGRTLDPVEKARLAQKAEHEYAGMPCGIMDQFSSTLGEAGRLLLIDCRSETAELVPLDDPEVAVLIVNSNVKHELTGTEYADRRRQCHEAASRLGAAALRDVTSEQLNQEQAKLDLIFYRRARHVITENERTLQAAAALKARDWQQVGELMYASHASLRDDFEVSCPELDALVEIAQSIGQSDGVIGARMTGGGFGGCIVALVQAAGARKIADRIAAAYKDRRGIAATPFVTKPARGAHIIK